MSLVLWEVPHTCGVKMYQERFQRVASSFLVSPLIILLFRNHNPHTCQYPDPYRDFLAKHLVTQYNLKNHVNIKSMTGKMWINDRETL
jgi:hypothetical protein